MLAEKDLAPERSIYYVGACVIKVLSEAPFDTIDLEVVFAHLNAHVSQPKLIPFSYFLMALDWLFLIGLISITENGDLRRCF